MSLELVNQSDLVIFLSTDNHEYTYRTVASLSLALHPNDLGLKIFLLDIEGSSQNLTNNSLSISLDQVQKFDLNNPNKTFVIIVTPTLQENIVKLKQAWHMPVKISDKELDQQTSRFNSNSLYPNKTHNDAIYRYQGTGAIIKFVFFVENVFELGHLFKNIQELAEYDFAGYMFFGLGNYNQFKLISTHSRIAGKPLVTVQPNIMFETLVRPKKLRVCYSATMIRFMAIENIKYFFKMQEPELFEQVEFINLAEREVVDTIRDLENSVAFICLDMAQEYPILMPEAMKAANIILGFSGSFDNPSELNERICDFSEEGNYRDVSDKLIFYIKNYYQNLQHNPDYIHPLAVAAYHHATVNFNISSQIRSLVKLLKELNIKIE